MKDRSKLRALALLAALVAVIALGTAVYPWMARQAQREEASAAPTQAPAQEQDAPSPQDTLSQTEEPAAEPEAAGPVFKLMAPDFTVYDAQGDAVRLRDYRGTPVIANFFASWCGPCKMEMPHFDAAIPAYEGRIQFLMVDLNAFGNDTAEAAVRMVEEGGYAFPILFDTDGEATLAYSVRSMPTTIFVAADGELLGTQIGAMSKEMLDAGIAKVLGE